jgi:hypothetical protein
MVNTQGKRTKIEHDVLGRVVKQIVPKKPRLGDPVADRSRKRVRGRHDFWQST